jgi:hypothetical protein
MRGSEKAGSRKRGPESRKRGSEKAGSRKRGPESRKRGSERGGRSGSGARKAGSGPPKEAEGPEAGPRKPEAGLRKGRKVRKRGPESRKRGPRKAEAGLRKGRKQGSEKAGSGTPKGPEAGLLKGRNARTLTMPGNGAGRRDPGTMPEGEVLKDTGGPGRGQGSLTMPDTGCRSQNNRESQELPGPGSPWGPCAGPPRPGERRPEFPDRVRFRARRGGSR